VRFSEQALKRFRKARFQGLTFEPDAIGLGGRLERGLFVAMALRCQDNRITEARFRSFNCISIIAAADLVCETLEGCSLTGARRLTAESILQALGGLPPSRRFCVGLVHQALQNVLEEAERKGILTCESFP
jgi:NifU-like protein involved in Fe-S cluster formation